MKKTIIITLTILSVLMILDTSNASHGIAMFLLAGAVPGTNLVVDATGMLAVISFIVGFIATRIAAPFTQRLIVRIAELVEIRRSNPSTVR